MEMGKRTTSRLTSLMILFLTLTVFFYSTVMQLPSFFSGKEPAWQVTAAARRSVIHDKIPKEWLLSSEVLEQAKSERKLTQKFIEGLLDSDTLEITSLDTIAIPQQIQKGALTATKVVKAFCKRAAFAHQLNNNLLEIAFESAFERAAELDAYFKENSKLIGPLHGLPFTSKDQFHLKGLPATMGYVGWIGTFEGEKGTGKEDTTESELITSLHSLGAIPIAKTTLVQSLWAGETNNNILGYNWNPQVTHLSSGGSSGGEGALQALRGSTFGFGTDIGGSVSMPAAFNGVYSIKPSHGRISYKNVATSSPGQTIMPSVVGIFSHSIASLQLVYKSLLSTEPWHHDPEVINQPWKDEPQSTSKLSFGLFLTDGVVSPHPPIQRALKRAANALRSDGHQIIAWEPPSHSESQSLHRAFTEADGNNDVLDAVNLSGEPLIQQIESMFNKRQPNKPKSVPDVFNATLRLNNFRTRYQDYWSSTAEKTESGLPVDAVLLPVAPHAAVIPGQFYYYTYSSIVNVLDYVSIVIPVTTADKDIDIFDNQYKPLNSVDKKNWRAYDPEKYHGAPAAIQLLGRRLEEQKLLAVAQIIVDALQKHPTG